MQSQPSETSPSDQAHHLADESSDLFALARQQVRGCRAAYGRMLQGWAQDVLVLRAKGISKPCWTAAPRDCCEQDLPATSSPKRARQHQPRVRAAGHQQAA